MEDKTTLCVSVQAGEHLLSGPDWLKIDDTKTLIDVLVEVSGTQALGYQVQVIVSKEPSFTEAALMQIVNCVSMLRSSGSIYVKFLLKSSVLPSKQRYEETKCKAERDTDVPLIESLLKSPVEDQRESSNVNEMLDLFEKPFESNYLNTLLSEQKLSSSTLASLRRELIKKKPCKNVDHYTTWQEQCITSPKRDFYPEPLGSQFVLCNSGENDRDDSEAREPKGSKPRQCDELNLNVIQDDISGEKPEQKKDSIKPGNNGHEEIVDVSLNMGTNGDLQQVDTRKDSFKDVDKQKDQRRKVAIRKTIVPKTNRSTALRVKKNSAASSVMQRKDKTEAAKSGMPVLAQKMTICTTRKPSKTFKPGTNTPNTRGGQTKSLCPAVKRNPISKNAMLNGKEEKASNIHQKASMQKLRLCARKATRVCSSDSTLKQDSSPGESKEIVKNNLGQRLSSPSQLKSGIYEMQGKVQIKNEIESKTESQDRQVMATSSNFGSMHSEKGILRGGEESIRNSISETFTEENSENILDGKAKEIASARREDLECVKDFISNRFIDSCSQASKDLARTEQSVVTTDACITARLVEPDHSTSPLPPTSNEGKTTVSDLKNCVLITGDIHTLSGLPLTSTPNIFNISNSDSRSVFSFVESEGSFNRNETVDSVDEMTIYESSNVNRRSGRNDVKHAGDSINVTEIVDGEGLRASTGTESKDFDSEDKLANHTNFSSQGRCDKQIDKNVEPVCYSEKKEQSSNLIQDNGCSSYFENQTHEDLILSDKSKFFNMVSNQTFHGRHFRSSFDSFDFVESSEMERKSLVNEGNIVKRSESLDRYSKGAIPKRSGFFQDLKERTLDATCGILSNVDGEYPSMQVTDLPCSNSSFRCDLDNENIISSFDNALIKKKSPLRPDRSILNITLNEEDATVMEQNAKLDIKKDKKPNGESPVLLSDIGRDSAVSRTFSLEGEKDKNIAHKEAKKVLDANQLSEKGSLKSEEGKKLDRKDDDVKCDLEFGKDMKCHIRKKWTIECGIIDQLLIDSLHDQSSALNATADRILSTLRLSGTQGEKIESLAKESQKPSAESVSCNIGATGQFFKALQALERKLNEIENNLGRKVN